MHLYITVNTHVHADHITGTGKIKEKVPTCKSVISAVSKATADVKLGDGDTVKFGNFEIEARSTPGHTGGIVTYTAELIFNHYCRENDVLVVQNKQYYILLHNDCLIV